MLRYRIPLPAAAAILAFAFGCGWFVASRPPPHMLSNVPAPPALNTRPPPSAPSPATPLSEDNRDLGTEPNPARDDAPAPAISSELRRLLKDRHSNIYFPVLDDDETRVSPTAVALLNLSPDEETRTAEVLQQTRDAIHSLCHTHLKVVSHEKDKAVLTLAPLPEAGAIKQRFQEGLAQAVGPERADILVARLDADSFMRFGVGEQTIEIEWKDDLVTVNHSYKTTDGEQGSSNQTFEQLPKLYDDLLTLR